MTTLLFTMRQREFNNNTYIAIGIGLPSLFEIGEESAYRMEFPSEKDFNAFLINILFLGDRGATKTSSVFIVETKMYAMLVNNRWQIIYKAMNWQTGVGAPVQCSCTKTRTDIHLYIRDMIALCSPRS